MTKNKELYPVYIILFANTTNFGNFIRKFTKQDYTHSTISLDSSLNNMYSFSGVPFSEDIFNACGFVRESLWSPQYAKNKYFTVIVTFTDKQGIKTIQKTIDDFKNNYTNYKYNNIGLIRYYFKFKEYFNDDNMKKSWFCSEFVSYLLTKGNIDGFDNLYISPGDIYTRNKDNTIILGDYTIKTFNEKDLIKRTEVAKQQFIQNNYTKIGESVFIDNESNILTEGNIQDIFPFIPTNKDESATKYTALLDWKRLYLEYIRLFKYSAPELRFKLIELIIRKKLIPNKMPVYKATDIIIEEMNNIQHSIHGRIISYIDVSKGEIDILINGKIKSTFYPIDYNK